MKLDEIVDEILQLSSFAVGNGDVCEIIARRLRRLAEKIEGVDVPPTGELMTEINRLREENFAIKTDLAKHGHGDYPEKA